MAQNILDRYRDKSLRVYVVWVHRWATDSRAEIDGAGLVDPPRPVSSGGTVISTSDRLASAAAGLL